MFGHQLFHKWQLSCLKMDYLQTRKTHISIMDSVRKLKDGIHINHPYEHVSLYEQVSPYSNW